MTYDVDGIRCMQMRGGSSKGAYYLREDLPADRDERDDLLLRIMGSPDERQIDGVGGGHPLTSKVAVVGPSPVPHRVHAAIGVLGAVSVAAAVRAPGTAANPIGGAGRLVRIEHPTGSFEVNVDLDGSGPGTRVRDSAVVRTARKLSDGLVWPRSGRAIGERATG
jgi:2-methylaconitate cis-trans-isomerase PrpF